MSKRGIRPNDSVVSAALWDLIEGMGGLRDYRDREWVEFNESDMMAGARWVTRCMGNPNSTAGTLIFRAIEKERARRNALPEQPSSSTPGSPTP